SRSVVASSIQHGMPAYTSHRGGALPGTITAMASLPPEEDRATLQHFIMNAIDLPPRTFGRGVRPDMGAHRRQERMSEDKIALAPSAARRSMMAGASLRLTIARTATQRSSASGDMVGDSRPGVILAASSSRSRGQL